MLILLGKASRFRECACVARQLTKSKNNKINYALIIMNENSLQDGPFGESVNFLVHRYFEPHSGTRPLRNRLMELLTLPPHTYSFPGVNTSPNTGAAYLFLFVMDCRGVKL